MVCPDTVLSASQYVTEEDIESELKDYIEMLATNCINRLQRKAVFGVFAYRLDSDFFTAFKTPGAINRLQRIVGNRIEVAIKALVKIVADKPPTSEGPENISDTQRQGLPL
jgi:hypothetical protein